MENQFEALSVHQQMQFLHDFYQRAKAWLPQRRNQFLGQAHASDEELMNNNTLFRCLDFARHETNRAVVQAIYKKLNPQRSIELPNNLDFQSVVIMVHAQFFHQYYPTIPAERILELARKALLSLSAVNLNEAVAINQIIEFDTSGPTLYFRFLNRHFRCRLNRRSELGFEMTLINEKVQKTRRPMF